MRLCFSRQVRKIPVYASHNFAFEITLSQAITLTLLLVYSRGPLIYARNDIVLRTEYYKG